MSDADLLARACETNAGFLALGNERFEAHGATFIRNRTTPGRYDANGAVLIRCGAPSEIDAFLQRFEREYADFKHRQLAPDPLTPPQFVARLMLDGGYSTSEYLILVLEGALQTTPKPLDIRETLADAEWEAYAALDELWSRESWDPAWPAPDRSMLSDFERSKRLKSPSTRAWLAYTEGTPCGFLSSWPGDNGVGIVEDLFVHSAYRHRGIATALLVHGVADARARGAGPVIINADPRDTPKQMYAALGFRPLYLARSYWKNFERSSPAPA